MDTLERALVAAVSSGGPNSSENIDVDRVESRAGTSNAIILSPIEQRLVKVEIEKTNDEIDALDEQIARLTAIRRGKSAVLYILQTAIAPHKNLPLEVLSLIFTHTLPPPDPNHCALSIPSGLSNCSSPWNLRQVCSSWRRVALSNFNLWNSIAISWSWKPLRKRGAASDPKTLAQYLNIACEILPRLGPIHLEFYLRDETTPCRNILKTYLEHFVEPRQHQVKSLKFKVSCGHEVFEPIYMNPLSLKMPLLETVQLACIAQDEHLHDERDESVTFFHSYLTLFRSKALQGLRFVGGSSSMANAFHVLRNPWVFGKLTKLDLEHQPISTTLSIAAGTISWAEFCEPLHLCTNLVELTLKLVDPVTPSSTPEHILLPELKSLTLYTATPFILDSFTLPNLQRLKYRSGIDMGIEKLTAFLKRSKCSLTSFIEDGRPKGTHPAPIERAKWEEFLKDLDTVQEFETTTVFTPLDFARLGTGEILPLVESVVIPAPDPSSAFDLIERRIGSSNVGCVPTKLRRVCIGFRHSSRWHMTGVFPSFGHARAIAEARGSVIEFNAIRSEDEMRRIV